MTVKAGELKGVRDRNALAAFNYYNVFIDDMLKKEANLREKLIVELYLGHNYGLTGGYKLLRETAEMLCSEYGRNGWHTSITKDPDPRDNLLILTIKEIE